MIEHELGGAIEAVEALEALLDTLADLSEESRREAMATFRRFLTADQLRIRMRESGGKEWAEEWKTRSRRILVGREHGCDIALDRSQVSGAHFELERFGSKVTIRDLGSRMGTSLAGERLDAFSPKVLSPHTVFGVAGVLEFMILPPPRELRSYDGSPVVNLNEKQLLVLSAIRELRSGGIAVGPRSLAEKLNQPNFADRSISRRVMELREALEVPHTEQREEGYTSILRRADQLGL